MASQIWDELLKIPPVTRALLLGTGAVTLPVLLKLVSPYVVVFAPELLWKGEVWRLVTSFLYGGAGLTFLFDMMTLFRNSSALEEGQYSGHSYDYAWHMLLAAGAILLINLPLGSFLHFHPLILSLVTLSSRLTPDAPVSLMGVVSLPLKFLPFAMLAMDVLMAGPMEAGRGLTGVMVGVGWGLALEKGLAPAAPGVVRSWVGSGLRVGVTPGGSGIVNPGRAVPAGGSGVINPGRGRGAAAAAPARREEASGRSSGYNWGQGHRLGE